MYTASKNYAITMMRMSPDTREADVIDPADTTNKEGKIANHLIETIINIEDRTKGDLSEIKAEATTKFKKLIKSGTTQDYIDFLEDFFADLGLFDKENDNGPLSSNAITRFVLTEWDGKLAQDIHKRPTSKLNINTILSRFLDTEVTHGLIQEADVQRGELDVVKQLLTSKGAESLNYKKFLMRPEGSLKY